MNKKEKLILFKQLLDIRTALEKDMRLRFGSRSELEELIAELEK